MKLIIALFTLTSALLLTACGPVHGRDTEYVDAKSVPDLKVPKDVPADKFKNYYPIPKLQSGTAVTAASMVPPGLDQSEQQAATAETKKK